MDANIPTLFLDKTKKHTNVLIYLVLLKDGRLRPVSQANKYFILILQGCLVLEPNNRLTCAELLDHSYFDGFREQVVPELNSLIAKCQHPQFLQKPKKNKVSIILNRSSVNQYCNYRQPRLESGISTYCSQGGRSSRLHSAT